MKPNEYIKISDEVKSALAHAQPIVALESTVITHGLPYPDNFKIALELESIVKEDGAQPASIAVLDGRIQVGLNSQQLERLATEKNLRKISLRDFAPSISSSQSGGTTVAGTMYIAHQVGIHVFATGGIGGVHRQIKGEDQGRLDISTDLTALSRIPIIVVCAGAKAILDIPTTLEMLETLGVLVVGYQTDQFPAFFSGSSGLRIDVSTQKPSEIAHLARVHWDLGLESAILVAVPAPSEIITSGIDMEHAIKKALDEAQKRKVTGQKVTPFLLERVNELTNGNSLKINLDLLKNNARIAAQIAIEMKTV